MGPVRQLLILLWAVILKSAWSHLRILNISEERFPLDKASNHCRQRNMHLVTLYDEDDAKLVAGFLTESKTVWVGLRRKTNHNRTETPLCPSITAKQPEERMCSEKLYFKCEKGPMVRVNLSWCSSRQFCHYHSLGDLTRDKSLKNEPGIFWIGGSMTDNWEWEDGGCSTFRNWVNEVDFSRNVATFNTELMAMTAKESGELWPALCSKGEVRMMVVTHLTATWEQALEYCDRHHSGLLQIFTAEDGAAVEQLLHGTGLRGLFWVGLRQSLVFGFWIWKDRMVEHSNWVNGTPPTMPLSHPCGVIQMPGLQWAGHNCLHPLHFICEERIVKSD